MGNSSKDASKSRSSNSARANGNGNGRPQRSGAAGMPQSKSAGYVDIIDRLDLSGLGMSGECSVLRLRRQQSSEQGSSITTVD